MIGTDSHTVNAGLGMLALVLGRLTLLMYVRMGWELKFPKLIG
jgi:aconitase A